MCCNSLIRLSCYSKQRFEHPVSYSESRFLILSSSLFLIAFIVGLLYGAYIHSTLSLLSCLASINYWRSSGPSWRYDCDVFLAKLTFLVFFVTGIFYVNEIILQVIGWIVCILSLLSFYFSNYGWEKKSQLWIYCHFFFHVCTSINMCLVIHGSYTNTL